MNWIFTENPVLLPEYIHLFCHGTCGLGTKNQNIFLVVTAPPIVNHVLLFLSVTFLYLTGIKDVHSSGDLRCSSRVPGFTGCMETLLLAAAFPRLRSLGPLIPYSFRSHSKSGFLPVACEKTAGSSMWVYVLLGNILRGIGEAPIMPLGISYLDDFSKEENTPFYLG